MILWQRQATEKWIATNEELLANLAGPNLAIITRPGRRRRLAQVVCRRSALAGFLQKQFGGTTEPLPRDWLQQMPPHPPIRIGRRLVVVSEATRDVRDGPHLIIPAAGAFGTGEHPTTAMSLRLLEETTRIFRPGWRLFDAGTGTGILALSARRLGAGDVVGVDNDSRAIANARQNARLNHLRRVKFVRGDLLQWKHDRARGDLRRRLQTAAPCYQIVTANLFSELLIAALPIFRRALVPEGQVIISGILRRQVDAVVAGLRDNGFSLEKTRRRGKWLALLARRKS